MQRLVVLLLWGFALLAACGDNYVGDIGVIAPAEFAAPIAELVALTPYNGLHMGSSDGITITVVRDGALPTESYRIDQLGPHAYQVDAPDVLGAQYGVSAALENLGFVFRHPFDPEVPQVPADLGRAGVIHTPELRVRGMHFHTLHPVEAHFAFWEPSVGGTDDAHRIIDWVIKNRGNYVQWAGLNDIIQEPTHHDAWVPYTQELLAYAHMRGVKVGFDLELFGSGNLQLAFDLVNDTAKPFGPQIAARLPIITQNLPFDVYDLSFGEFFGADPDIFIGAVNEVRRQLRTLAPQAEMHALVHVGATQRVQYMGQDLIYYFLVKFADPSIIPDVHTVMYYDLFEPTDGAYHHADFSEHRAYLQERMCASPPKPAAYHPEDAYWVAFDNSVPQWFPLYVRSRWLDLHNLETMPNCKLDEQLLFSSGFEWGYWLNDVTALRGSYDRYDSYQAMLVEQLGDEAATFVAGVTELQHAALMGDKLAPYMASRDVAIDSGRQLGVVSQPDRVTYDDLVAGADKAAFEASVLTPMQAYADVLAAVKAPAGDDRWIAEMADGLAIDQLRPKFMLATYRAVLAKLRGDADEAARQQTLAQQLRADAQVVVSRRHAHLHDTHGRRLLDRTPNDTFYQYGYLRNADILCFWDRELGQVAGVLGNQSMMPPGCLF